ncbi:hypothetical protein Tco_0891238 [Tanacetum coccineum]|uniref:Zinc finger, CCHC-type n=1 Tax=Tanacetum coccineum TaxID=301880 RepID=A0ABQ5C5Q6_9ASTR
MSPGTKLCNHIDEFNKLILDLANIDIEIEDENQKLMLLTLLPSSYENFMETLLYERESLTMEDGHLKRDCPMKKSSGLFKKDKRDHDSDSSDDEGNAYFGEALVVVENDEMAELVMDSSGSYHMTHMRDFLYDIKGFDGGSVQLGLRRSLISLGTLKKEGYTMKMQMDRIKVIKGCRGMMIEIEKKNCFNNLVDNKLGSNNFVMVLQQESHKVKKIVFWFEGGTARISRDQEAEVFLVVNDDAVMWLKDGLEEGQLEKKSKLDCLVKEKEKVHLDIKAGENIMITGVPGQEGARG